ncbi:MAG: hypothetical protein WC533_01305 [Candidatus Pacearchaeota archaeon]
MKFWKSAYDKAKESVESDIIENPNDPYYQKVSTDEHTKRYQISVRETRIIQSRVTEMGLLLCLGVGIWTTSLIRGCYNQGVEWESLYKKAQVIADTNHDGNLSLDERINMLKDMKLSPNIPGDTRYPTKEELENYIKSSSEKRK